MRVVIFSLLFCIIVNAGHSGFAASPASIQSQLYDLILASDEVEEPLRVSIELEKLSVNLEKLTFEQTQELQNGLINAITHVNSETEEIRLLYKIRKFNNGSFTRKFVLRATVSQIKAFVDFLNENSSHDIPESLRNAIKKIRIDKPSFEVDKVSLSEEDASSLDPIKKSYVESDLVIDFMGKAKELSELFGRVGIEKLDFHLVSRQKSEEGILRRYVVTHSFFYDVVNSFTYDKVFLVDYSKNGETSSIDVSTLRAKTSSVEESAEFAVKKDLNVKQAIIDSFNSLESVRLQNEAFDTEYPEGIAGPVTVSFLSELSGAAGCQSRYLVIKNYQKSDGTILSTSYLVDWESCNWQHLVFKKLDFLH